MGFADAYLLKAGLREALIEPEPHPGLKISVTIPVYHESGLERCLDSLFQCSCGEHPAGKTDGGPDGEPGSGFHAEVLILINASCDAPVAILEQNCKKNQEVEIPEEKGDKKKSEEDNRDSGERTKREPPKERVGS